MIYIIVLNVNVLILSVSVPVIIFLLIITVFLLFLQLLDFHLWLELKFLIDFLLYLCKTRFLSKSQETKVKFLDKYFEIEGEFWRQNNERPSTLVTLKPLKKLLRMINNYNNMYQISFPGFGVDTEGRKSSQFDSWYRSGERLWKIVFRRFQGYHQQGFSG